MQVITRIRAKKPLMSVEEAVAADRAWFDAHPEADSYIRQFVPGEFGKAELPAVPPGWRFATHVCVRRRLEGAAVGRQRQLMVFCEQP
ncbi:hypothetical protein XH99_01060 [Bradyrhizobium nanningense]|uniref:Uncharacterized protein n=1 Tax=Bradyrhizobium nanningense TaxID=1325118 RepID=A0A4Q0SIJ6_9BRAD|nr:hypothetical protein [Bradyrhizobium nanningense]RXH34366.1 hypothetical protein XH84_07020 [Bradyrhizobium nanningense]RXH38380.1 hypothetical protein XH99_01060 [Bradyrhizobium nanningense]